MKILSVFRNHEQAGEDGLEKCAHQGRFIVLGNSRIGNATCKECGADVGLDDAINVYLKKMDAILDKHGIE